MRLQQAARYSHSFSHACSALLLCFLQVYRLTEALEKSQREASWAKQRHETAESQLAKASHSAALLEAELRKLQQEHESLGQQVATLTAGKATAERAAAVGETRAATAEALLQSKAQELEQLQVHYKRLLAEQQAELERLRQQVKSHASEHSKCQSAAATQEQELLRELQTANSSLVDLKTSLAAEQSSNELLKAKATELTAELETLRQSKQQLAANLKQVRQSTGGADQQVSSRSAIHSSSLHVWQAKEQLSGWPWLNSSHAAVPKHKLVLLSLRRLKGCCQNLKQSGAPCGQNT